MFFPRPARRSRLSRKTTAQLSLELLEDRLVLKVGLLSHTASLAAGSHLPALLSTMEPTFRFASGNSLQPDQTASPTGISPANMRHAYGADAVMFGSVTGDGTGQTIAIVDAYDQPNVASDLAAFDAYYGLPAPPSFTKVNETGGSTLPAPAEVDGWGVEISLDVEWAHVIAPEASILLVEANSASNSDLFTAVNTARNAPGVSVVSMSWSGDEDYTDPTYNSYFTTPAGHNGVTFLAAAGDNGAYSNWGTNAMVVGYPAASPNVIGVGGTTLETDSFGDYLFEKRLGLR